MSNNSSDIRNLMNLLENVQKTEPTLLEGWVDNLKQKIHGHLGTKERQQLAGRLQKEWSTWLGQTRRQGTLDDMERFMKIRIGFKDQDIENVLKTSGFEYGDEEPETDEPKANDTPAARQTIKKTNPNATSEPKGEPDAEEGTPLPTDLDTKLSDYKDIKPGEQPNGSDESEAEGKPYKVYQENPKNYMNGNEWDEAKLRKRKSQLKPGEELHLGNRKFRKPWPGDESNNFVDPRTMKADESINEAETATDNATDDTDVRNKVLAPDQVAEIMDASAAQINDEYLYNGPENEKKDAAAARALSQVGGRRNAFRVPGAGNLGADLGPNEGGRKGSGTYDTAEMLDVLQTVNYNKSRVPSLERKVAKATSISEMTDQDMQELALIGFAFLRART